MYSTCSICFLLHLLTCSTCFLFYLFTCLICFVVFRCWTTPASSTWAPCRSVHNLSGFLTPPFLLSLSFTYAAFSFLHLPSFIIFRDLYPLFLSLPSLSRSFSIFLFRSLAVFHYLQRLVSDASFIAVSFSFLHCHIFLFLSLSYLSLSFFTIASLSFLHHRIFLILLQAYTFVISL